MGEIVKICKIHGNLLSIQVRMVSNGKRLCMACIQCLNEKAKRCRNKNPEKEKERRKIQYIKHRERQINYRKEYLARPEIKEKVKLTRRAYGIKNKDKLKDKTLRLKFNITIEQYNELLETQNHVCAICYQKERVKAGRADYIKDLAVDHCHSTNIVRGLLCNDCNAGLGQFKDSIDRLQNAINYIIKHNT